MTTWTDPTPIPTNSQSDSDKFNREVVENLRYLHVARVARLGMIKSLTVPSGQWVSMLWDIAVFDHLGCWTAAPYPERLTPAVPGYYRVSAAVQWPPNAAGARAVRLHRNGRDKITQTTLPPVATTTGTTLLTAVVDLSGIGDYINLHVWQSSGVTLTIPPAQAHDVTLSWEGGAPPATKPGDVLPPPGPR